MSVRPHLQEALGHVAHARYSLVALQEVVLREMRKGYRPTYRGHEWNKEQFAAITGACTALEVAFHLLKYVQFPETAYRLEEVSSLLGRLRKDEEATASLLMEKLEKEEADATTALLEKARQERLRKAGK